MKKSFFWIVAAFCAFVGSAALSLAGDSTNVWLAPAFDFVAHQFYEIPLLATIRRPSQLILTRIHLEILLGMIGLVCCAAPWLDRRARGVLGLFCVGYALRAIVWIIGGNLPLVPGDDCHYLETATSVWRGEGSVKHYVESFFTDYVQVDGGSILKGRGVLDDWATPLYADALALAFRLCRVVPLRSLEQTVAVAKGTSFVFNLACLPLLYLFARRRFNADIAFWSLAALVFLPVHLIYAGFGLREALVAFTSLLAVWTATEAWSARGRSLWIWTSVAGISAGLAILARNTAMALALAIALAWLVSRRKQAIGPLILWSIATLAVIAPWAWETTRVYGEPFHTYTKYFPYNFSWTIHHYDTGNTTASQFYTLKNLPDIVRIKIKSLIIIVIYSTMIFSLPLALGFIRRLARPVDRRGREVDAFSLLAWLVFIVATLVNVADVTQVAQLGRYYLPLFVIALPTAVAGIREAIETWKLPRAAIFPLAASWLALVWADPTWAYDAAWLVKPYQLHWPALREAGDWIKAHPKDVPDDARIMTWFPWELRVGADRTTILLPRNFNTLRIAEVIQRYKVTHVLWGSFEPPGHVEPEAFGLYLERKRLDLGLTKDRELYHSAERSLYPVRLYRLGQGGKR